MPAVTVAIPRSWVLWYRLRRGVLILLVAFGWFVAFGAAIGLANPSGSNNNSTQTNIILVVVFAGLSAWGTWIAGRKGRGPRIHQVIWPSTSACPNCGGPMPRDQPRCQFCGYSAPTFTVDTTVELK